MGGSNNNKGNFFAPKNLISTALTGGIPIVYGAQELKANMKPPEIPNTPPPPLGAPPMSALDKNTAESQPQRQRRLASLRYGFASTLTNQMAPAPVSATGKTTLGS